MGMMQEFREFAVKGNAMDLAVGVIIGAAFGKIVDSIVSDLIMPVVGLVFGKLDFSNLFVALGAIPPDIPRTLDALKKAGVKVEHKVYAGTTHEFFGMAAVVPEAKQAQALAGKNLRQALK